MKVLAIAAANLRRMLRERSNIFFVFIFPIALILLIGIQFKIVASTVKWENELPDWPEYFSFGERVVEILTFVVIALLQYGPFVAYAIAFGDEGLRGEPRLGFWLGAAATLWLGTALSVMAWGAAATEIGSEL